jgi:hypothetical protein
MPADVEERAIAGRVAHVGRPEPLLVGAEVDAGLPGCLELGGEGAGGHAAARLQHQGKRDQPIGAPAAKPMPVSLTPMVSDTHPVGHFPRGRTIRKRPASG